MLRIDEKIGTAGVKASLYILAAIEIGGGANDEMNSNTERALCELTSAVRSNLHVYELAALVGQGCRRRRSRRHLHRLRGGGRRPTRIIECDRSE